MTRLFRPFGRLAYKAPRQTVKLAQESRWNGKQTWQVLRSILMRKPRQCVIIITDMKKSAKIISHQTNFLPVIPRRTAARRFQK